MKKENKFIIKAYDPTGMEHNSVEYILPDGMYFLTENYDGAEPSKNHRLILTIGKYVYRISKDGELILYNKLI